MGWIFSGVLLFCLVVVYCVWVSVQTKWLMKSPVFVLPEKVAPTRSLSVVVPYHDRPQSLLACISSLFSQQFPDTLLQVIIVNDSSEEIPDRALREIASRRPGISFVCLENKGTGKKTAILTALEQAGGEVVVLTDADCTHPPGWLACIEAGFRESGIHLLAGPVEKTGPGWVAAMDHADYSGMMLWGMASLLQKRPVLVSSCNLAVLKKSILDVQPYQSNLAIAGGDDIFLMQAIEQRFGSAALGVVLLEQAKVSTEACVSLAQYLSARIRWGAKTRYYMQSRTAGLALFVLGLYVLFFITAIGGFFAPYLWVLLFCMVSLKWFFDRKLFQAGRSRLGMAKTDDLFVFEWLQCLLIPYLALRAGMRDLRRW